MDKTGITIKNAAFYDTGGRIDHKGREIATLPAPDDGYREDLVGLNPDEMIAKLDEPKPERADQTSDLLRPGYTFDRGRSPTTGRKRKGKTGTWICKECHMEYCSHREKTKGYGRPSKEPTVRSAERKIRMTVATLATMREAGINASDALALFAIAYKDGLSLDLVVADWRRSHGCR